MSALAELEARDLEVEEYIEQTRERVRGYLKETGLSQSEAARLMGFSAPRLSQFLSGKYAGDVVETAKQINYGLDKHQEQVAAPREPDFAPTSVAKQVEDVCSYTHRMQVMGMVYGNAGLGKSMAIAEYAKAHPDVVILSVNTTLRSGKAVLEELADCLGVREYGTERNVAKAIVRALRGSGRLIIIDEAQHLSKRALDTLRFLHDEAKVGFVFCGNNELYLQLLGRSRSEFAQFFSRIGIRRHLGDTVNHEDVELIFAEHNLSKPCLDALFAAANDGQGLRGMVNTYLLAASIAQARGSALTAADLQEAYRFRMSR